MQLRTKKGALKTRYSVCLQLILSKESKPPTKIGDSVFDRGPETDDWGPKIHATIQFSIIHPFTPSLFHSLTHSPILILQIIKSKNKAREAGATRYTSVNGLPSPVTLF